MNTFYNQMFNPQYVNPIYYNQISQQQEEMKQCREIANAVNAIRDLCKAIKQLDDKHHKIAVDACIIEMAKELNW